MLSSLGLNTSLILFKSDVRSITPFASNKSNFSSFDPVEFSNLQSDFSLPSWWQDFTDCSQIAHDKCFGEGEEARKRLDQILALVEGTEFAECVTECLIASSALGPIGTFALIGCLSFCYTLHGIEDEAIDNAFRENLLMLFDLLDQRCYCTTLFLCLLEKPSNIGTEVNHCCNQIYIQGEYNGQEIPPDERPSRFIECIEDAIGGSLPAPQPQYYQNYTDPIIIGGMLKW